MLFRSFTPVCVVPITNFLGINELCIAFVTAKATNSLWSTFRDATNATYRPIIIWDASKLCTGACEGGKKKNYAIVIFVEVRSLLRFCGSAFAQSCMKLGTRVNDPRRPWKNAHAACLPLPFGRITEVVDPCTAFWSSDRDAAIFRV